MGVNGMKRNREGGEMAPKVEVSVNLFPFGSMSYEIAGGGKIGGKKKPDIPIYTEPLTTNIDKVEIRLQEDETYSVPKITAGM